MLHGTRIRESSGTTKKTLAKEKGETRKRELKESASGGIAIVKPKKPKVQFLASVSTEFMEQRKRDLVLGKLASSTFGNNENCLVHLLAYFQKTACAQITKEQVEAYQLHRIEEEDAAGSTVNLEVRLLRTLLIRAGYKGILKGLDNLPENADQGRNLSAEEETALVQASEEVGSLLFRTVFVTALYTAARKSTILKLQWERVSFQRRSITIGKDKTRHGSGRSVPMSDNVFEALSAWAELFPDRTGTDYVFPFTLSNMASTGPDFDPSRPAADIQRQWHEVRVRAAAILTGNESADRMDFRFHDLRHTAISRMFAAGVPLQVVAKLVGWGPQQAAEMAHRYSHFFVDQLRSAADAINISSKSPVKSPVFENDKVVTIRKSNKLKALSA